MVVSFYIINKFYVYLPFCFLLTFFFSVQLDIQSSAGNKYTINTVELRYFEY